MGAPSGGLGWLERASIADEALGVPLIEREHVWERATRGLETARSGRGSLVLLDAPAGLGKSALIRAIGSHAAETGMEVLTAAGRRGEEEFGFGVVVQLFESRLDDAEEEERARFFSEAAREAVPIFTPGNREVEPTFDVLHGLYRLCAKLAFDTPLAILIDDVDLADWQSLRFLAYLAERMGDNPMALVLAAGSVPRSRAPEPVDQIARHPATARCELPPLTARGTAERIHATWPEATEETCRGVHEASGGNPFLIDALTAELAGIAGEAAPAIAAWTLRRAGWIHEDAAALLRAIAVLAPRCETRNAATLAALDAETATAVADVLIEAGILKPEEHLAFEQPAVADAIEAFQAPGERSAAHLAAARLRRADEESPEIVASHLLKAARTASGWVVDSLSAAGAIALGRGAPADAVRYLRRALDEPPPRQQRAHVVLELGRAEAMAGEPQAAARLSEASEWAETQEQPATALATGRALFALGRPKQAMAVFERALQDSDEPESDLDGSLRAGHAAALWLTRLPYGDTVGPAAPPESADTPGDRALLALHAMEGAIRGAPCSEVRDLAVRALARGALLDDETADGLIYYLATTALALAEDLQTAEAALTAAVEDAQVRGSVLGFATASHARAMAILMRGRVMDAAADARNALGVECDGWRLGLGGARVVLAHSLVESGDLAGAERHLEAAEAVTGEAHPFRISLLSARGRVQLLNGDADRALEDFLACGELGERAGARNPAIAPWRSGAGLACAVIGDLTEAERLIESELSLAQSFGAPGPIGRALRAMASIREPQPALEALEAAVETLEVSQAALERARALVDFGAALRRSGRRREARAPLRAGLELARGCGAEVLALRAMRETTAAGARPRRTALTGLDSLTARERQVASLAAEGFSNREIAETLVVTVKTVEWHLKHSYRKLGLDSRQRLREFFGPAES